ncbi:MAG: succinylglutamate desuccinylase/aspartoacylase family protein [Gammaproteobacteria bacterium]|nr:succinylglutamate desuccinylase/aspartoacylase family protein [Gammaproteobacteria bacterium]MCP5197875.1 succinylglutamate desuccinylase/aspartoacylase family protein [Gammaproteobacteria bacterium]
MWGQKGVLRYDIGPLKHTPQLALVANLHNNELNGMFVLSRLAEFLQSIEAGKRRGLRLRERVLIIPTVDVLHAMGRTQCHRSHCRIREAVSEVVMAMTRTAYYRVSICTADSNIEEMPQVLLHMPNDDERASACLFGLPAVVEQSDDSDETSELVRAWRLHGGENFVIHAGQSGSLQPRHCETLFRALVAFLKHTGVIDGLRLADGEEDLHYFDRRQVCNVQAEQSGVFASRLEVGRWIRAGEEVGQIYDGFTGDLRLRVIAPVAGLLAGLRRQPLLCVGDWVARILALDAALWRGAVQQRSQGQHHERQTAG